LARAWISRPESQPAPLIKFNIMYKKKERDRAASRSAATPSAAAPRARYGAEIIIHHTQLRTVHGRVALAQRRYRCINCGRRLRP